MDVFSLYHPEYEDVQEVNSCLDHYYASILNECGSTSTAFRYEEEGSITCNGNDEIFFDDKTTAEEVRAQPQHVKSCRPERFIPPFNFYIILRHVVKSRGSPRQTRAQTYYTSLWCTLHMKPL